MFTRRMSSLVVIVIVALVTLGLIASALPAFGAARALLPQHAELTSTSPKAGSTVDTADSVVLSFSEAIDPTFLRLTVEGPDGEETAGSPSVEGRSVTQPLRADLPAGEHEVSYRVVSVDGHPVSGSVVFTTTGPSTAPTPPHSDPTPAPSTDPTIGAATDPTAGAGTPGWVLPAGLAGIAVLAVLGLLWGGRRSRAGPGGALADGS